MHLYFDECQKNEIYFLDNNDNNVPLSHKHFFFSFFFLSIFLAKWSLHKNQFFLLDKI